MGGSGVKKATLVYAGESPFTATEGGTYLLINSRIRYTTSSVITPKTTGTAVLDDAVISKS